MSPSCCCYFIFTFYLLHVRVKDAGYTMHVEVRARFVFGSLLPAFGFWDQFFNYYYFFLPYSSNKLWTSDPSLLPPKG